MRKTNNNKVKKSLKQKMNNIKIKNKKKCEKIIKGSVRKNERGLNALLIATNLTSICCVYKEKIVKND